MAKKIVIKVNMANDKCRSKAMALVASTGGVVSVELAGDDKSKFVVVGDVDSIKLTNALRKKVDGSAQLVEVGEAKKEEKKKEEEKKKDELVAVYQPGYYCHPYMYHHPGYGPYGCPCGCNPKPEREAKKEEKKKEEEKKKDEPVAVYQPGYYYTPYYHHPGYGPYGCPCGCNPKPESTCSIINSGQGTLLQPKLNTACQKKIVIKVNMANDKCRSKAMALVASTGGVVSVELAGDDKSKFVVVGDVDSIKLTNALRKKVDGSAQLVEVGEAKKEEKKKEEEKKKDEPVAVYQPGYYCHPYMYHHPGYGPYGCPCGCNPKPESTCSIM
uniref:HMA domain-containing protein n=1 Tax=Leersia perrieri TaxID=77586 RepID=A0A0D9VHM9_9ORYZ